MMSKVQKNLNFEDAFKRLETILEKMNEGTIGLDESLKLYTEADELINFCSKGLFEAEKKIEVLVKKRNKLELDENDKPVTEDFS